MSETPTALRSRNRIAGRLYVIKYPNNKSPEVRFEVFSNGHTFGGEHRLPAQISNKLVLTDLLKDDFSEIVALAARKLSLDLRKLAIRMSVTTKPAAGMTLTNTCLRFNRRGMDLGSRISRDGE